MGDFCTLILKQPQQTIHDFAVINSLSHIFHECKKKHVVFPSMCVCMPQVSVLEYLCLAAQEKSLGASVAEGGGRWDMINFCPIEKKHSVEQKNCPWDTGAR